MARAVFVSDLHLTTPQNERGFLFLKLLKSWVGPARSSDELALKYLILGGDIFDLWIADHIYFQNQYADIIDEIRRLLSEGVRISYFEGNHDLYLKKYWQEHLGVIVHEGPAVLNLDGLQVWMCHGDQIDLEDRGYRFLRWILRTSFMTWVAFHLPTWLVVKLGEAASQSSRQYTSTLKTTTETKAVSLVREYSQKVARTRNLDFVIHGHLHCQDDYLFSSMNAKKVRSVNLGTWLKGAFQYFEIDLQNPQRSQFKKA